jgi:excisionase family DNA binding protein
MDRETCQARLTTIAQRLHAAGQTALADELAGLAREVATSPSWPGDLLTPSEAATALGVRSVNTVKRWAREGRLEGYALGGRMLVSQRSVDAFRQTKEARQQRAYEHQLDEALAPFDSTPEEIAEYTSETPPGRVPWRADATAAV